ncbi:alpha-E domain-containing protein [Pseudooceanicola sediminis]|uniref:Alpha-E domain-containing protein n=1 Tax=Pseudooceanicola sediminis TaxID=2211117 RepID=A0A399J1X2_9RHOB|nr:alpha-E domain-containing protein [Pseudooceanicola sediminis]KAA2314747.1 alpha-E domain-containing protein [Puniceibacterium sp. HSS470]RII39300.1 alpha-E domain-containing protein [Pseudooceanicola sediminis]
MLGRTAGGLFWMFRYLERSENTARLLETGFRIALTGAQDSDDSEWESIVSTAGVRPAYVAKFDDDFDQATVINYLLRDRDNPSSVMSCIEAARSNARMVRTALSSEVWEAVNEAWMTLKDQMKRPVSMKNLAEVLTSIRQHSSLVRGALHGTMLRNDIFDFARLGTYIERADNTSRILDIKYYVLLPSAAYVGSSMDNAQWETILRSVSAFRSFRWLNEGEVTPMAIADFMILDKRMPRSLAFCHSKIVGNLSYLNHDADPELPCLTQASQIHARLSGRDIDSVFDEGLHEFLKSAIADTGRLAAQIQEDFRFYG